MSIGPDFWVDKYAPSKLNDYIFKNKNVKDMVQSWIKRGWTDNLLLIGPPGTGKTSLSRVILNELDIDDSDYIKINASREGNIDTLRTKISQFIQSGGWGSEHRYILLDEADGMTHVAQPALRTDMEDYSDTVRWILTANSQNKIIPAVQDRCTVIQFDRPDQDRLMERMLEILEREGFILDDFSEKDQEHAIEVIDDIVSNNYPSVRKCIRYLQNAFQDGKLVKPQVEASVDESWKIEVYKAFESGDPEKGRNLIANNIAREEVADYFIWLYKNLDLTPDPNTATVHIDQGLVNLSLTPAPEITLSGALVKITQGL